MSKNIKISPTRERADVLLFYLEKLKDKIFVIETQYNFQSHKYTKVCEEAILKVNEARTDLEKEDVKLVKSDINLHEMSNLEARYKLGLVLPEIYHEHKEVKRKKTEPRQSKAQKVVNNVADGIEFALDKLGDGLIYPFVKIADLYNLLISRFGKKSTRRGKRR